MSTVQVQAGRRVPPPPIKGAKMIHNYNPATHKAVCGIPAGPTVAVGYSPQAITPWAAKGGGKCPTCWPADGTNPDPGKKSVKAKSPPPPPGKRR